MTHPNDMTHWPEIRCQREHATHRVQTVMVDLSTPHGYHDYPQVPRHLACRFPMAIWAYDDPDIHESGVGGYCPAVDAVSETIVEQGIWEPCETIITLSALSRADPDSLFVDFGGQIGWFSLLACQARRDVVVFEADPDCMGVIRHNMRLNDWDDHVSYRQERIGEGSFVSSAGRRIALAKIDIEGAEQYAVHVLWPSIEAGLVDHLLIEISPVFNDSYPDLVVRLLEAGYEAWGLPEKATPPGAFEQFPRDLEPTRLWPAPAWLRMPSDREGFEKVRQGVASWHQANVLFSRPGAPL